MMGMSSDLGSLADSVCEAELQQETSLTKFLQDETLPTLEQMATLTVSMADTINSLQSSLNTQVRRLFLLFSFIWDLRQCCHTPALITKLSHIFPCTFTLALLFLQTTLTAPSYLPPTQLFYLSFYVLFPSP